MVALTLEQDMVPQETNTTWSVKAMFRGGGSMKVPGCAKSAEGWRAEASSRTYFKVMLRRIQQVFVPEEGPESFGRFLFILFYILKEPGFNIGCSCATWQKRSCN